jgi:hypothetical protein
LGSFVAAGLALGIVVAAQAETSAPPRAAAAADDPYVVPARFFPFPKEYGVVAVFSAIAAAPDGKVYVGTSTYNHPSRLLDLDPATGRYRVAVDLGKVLPQDDAAFVCNSNCKRFIGRTLSRS